MRALCLDASISQGRLNTCKGNSYPLTCAGR
jgi:hypothetical protein